jgi:hypothetical protein
MLAEPTHHHALNPSRYPMPLAPTVEPAPIFAARNVANKMPGPKRRPATRKSDADFTRLAAITPIAISTTA